mmetsp:Transcript_18448/g.62219  ORF Transcript_18448/g.62219 Transcript_18448/m.62219 type:complete len:234 (+) Transcript_18448:414-1115(+)
MPDRSPPPPTTRVSIDIPAFCGAAGRLHRRCSVHERRRQLRTRSTNDAWCACASGRDGGASPALLTSRRRGPPAYSGSGVSKACFMAAYAASLASGPFSFKEFGVTNGTPKRSTIKSLRRRGGACGMKALRKRLMHKTFSSSPQPATPNISPPTPASTRRWPSASSTPCMRPGTAADAAMPTLSGPEVSTRSSLSVASYTLSAVGTRQPSMSFGRFCRRRSSRAARFWRKTPT